MIFQAIAGEKLLGTKLTNIWYWFICFFFDGCTWRVSWFHIIHHDIFFWLFLLIRRIPTVQVRLWFSFDLPFGSVLPTIALCWAFAFLWQLIKCFIFFVWLFVIFFDWRSFTSPFWRTTTMRFVILRGRPFPFPPRYTDFIICRETNGETYCIKIHFSVNEDEHKGQIHWRTCMIFEA